MERKTGLGVCKFDRFHDPLPSGDEFRQFHGPSITVSELAVFSVAYGSEAAAKR